MVRGFDRHDVSTQAHRSTSGTGYVLAATAGRGIRPVPNVYSVTDRWHEPTVSDGANAPVRQFAGRPLSGTG